MAYKIRKINGTPRLDALSVAKIIDYPLEERDYKPFAQCAACISGGRLYIRMWAFEAMPAISSELRSVLHLFKDKSLALNLRLYVKEQMMVLPECEIFLSRDGEHTADIAGYELHNHSGEDLQGIYWGGLVEIDLQKLAEMGGETLTNTGDKFTGNFYKLCGDEKYAHCGSFYPAKFPAEPYSRESMGDFEVIGG